MDETLEGRLQKSKELYLENQLHQYNKLKYEIEMLGRKNLELETVNMRVQDENMKLVRRIEEYQKLNKEWEFKVNNIRNNVFDLEENNKVMKKENENLIEEMDSLNFKLKLSLEKDKLNESNIKNFKEIQTEYENKLLENKKEFKIKEENMRKKYENFEENINKKVKEQEFEHNEKIQKLNQNIKELMKIISKKDEENWNLKEKIKNSELFYFQKEQEFNDLINIKDKKLKDLENCLKKINEEARNQLDSVSSVMEEYEKKFDEMRNKENKLLEEINNLKEFYNKKTENPNPNNISGYQNSKVNINSDRDSINNMNPNRSRISINMLDNEESKNRMIERLREKIASLEEENLRMANEIAELSKENEKINDELHKLYTEWKSKELKFNSIIKDKDSEINILNSKINDLDINIEKYENNLVSIRKNYDTTVYEYQQEILRKNEDIKYMIDAHAKEIKEMQNKFEQVLIKENQFLNSLNMNSFGNLNPLLTAKTSSKNVFIENMNYKPNPVNDDEAVRKNINEQLNYIKNQLDKSYYG